MIRRSLLPAALIAPLLLTGCVGVAASKSYQQNPTLGQQLTDLKIAYDKGAIDEQEYNQLKQGIINEAGRSGRR